jgi:hypothetical protein
VLEADGVVPDCRTPDVLNELDPRLPSVSRRPEKVARAFLAFGGRGCKGQCVTQRCAVSGISLPLVFL